MLPMLVFLRLSTASFLGLLLLCGMRPNSVGTATALSYRPVSSPPSPVSRARFLSSTATVFLNSITMVLAVVDPNHPDNSCAAAATNEQGGDQVSTNYNHNPRYMEKTLEMTYGYDANQNPRTRGMLVRRFTGDATPYQFPVTPIRLVKEWPRDVTTPPFTKADFARADELDDRSFYAVPRLVYHIDEPAVASLTQFYRNTIPPGSRILDICSSWVSHYPLEFPKVMKRISATGMSALELQCNDQLNDYEAKNLNDDPTLPYPDSSFDVVTCVVSIDYLVHPIQVLKEVQRVLRPGGKVIVSQSNRCFPSKAIHMWLGMNDRQHLELINGYFQYAGGFKEPRQAFDITATVPDNAPHDPMFVVVAERA